MYQKSITLQVKFLLVILDWNANSFNACFQIHNSKIKTVYSIMSMIEVYTYVSLRNDMSVCGCIHVYHLNM